MQDVWRKGSTGRGIWRLGTEDSEDHWPCLPGLYCICVPLCRGISLSPECTRSKSVRMGYQCHTQLLAKPVFHPSSHSIFHSKCWSYVEQFATFKLISNPRSLHFSKPWREGTSRVFLRNLERLYIWKKGMFRQCFTQRTYLNAW